MKTLKEYLISENRLSVEGFNKWLEDRYGYEDLYRYYSDNLDINWKGEHNFEKYIQELLDNTPPDIKDNAEDAGLSCQEYAIQVVQQCVPKH